MVKKKAKSSLVYESLKANSLLNREHMVIYHCSYAPGNVNEINRRWLSEEEVVRLAKMKSTRRQAEFTLSRYLMKRELGFTEHQASLIHLPLSDGYLRVEGYPEYAISLTHSPGNIAFIVFNPLHHVVGVDLEIHDQRRKFRELSTLFHPEEHSSSAQAFYRTWTLKEALAKTLNYPLHSMLSTPVQQLLEQHNLSFCTKTFPNMTLSLVHNLSSDLPVLIQPVSI